MSSPWLHLLHLLPIFWDNVCPLSIKLARSKPCFPRFTDNIRKERKELRAAERKWRKSRDANDLGRYQSLLSTFSSSVTAAKKVFYLEKVDNATDRRKLFITFKNLLNPL